MATGQLGSVFRQIGRLFGPGTVSGLTEAQLLARFIERRDEAAFEALVSRFGPMVLGVCRQVLADSHAVDDAFQATFLVLVKRARSIRDRDLLGNWLYGVALKVARRARADLAKRRAREQEGQPVAAEPIGDGRALDDLDLGPILHEELEKLPEKYRAPMVLCYLDGQTCEEAAGRLGWPVGTVKGRLSRARDLLRSRLSKRGVTASAALVAATLTKAAEASVSPMLLDQTVKAAMVLAAGGALAAAGLGSASAVALAEGVNATMILTKWKTFALAATLVGTLASGAAVMARQGFGGGQDISGSEGGRRSKTFAPAKTAVGEAGSADAVLSDDILDQVAKKKALRDAGRGAPVPPAIAAAERRVDLASAMYDNSQVTLDRLLAAIRDLHQAHLDATSYPENRAQLAQSYNQAMRKIVDKVKARFESGLASQLDLADAEFALAQAEAASKGGRGGSFGGAIPARDELGAIGQPAESDDPDSDRKIIAALGKPLAMPFMVETPLEDVIKYIKTSTVSKDFEQGLPIYVEPEGLQEAEKTMASPITLNLEGIKLKTSLRLLLKQISLGYYVKHGLVIITNLEDEDYLSATQPNWRRRMMMGGAMNGMGGMMGPGMNGMMGGNFGGAGGGAMGGMPMGGGGGFGGKGGGGFGGAGGGAGAMPGAPGQGGTAPGAGSSEGGAAPKAGTTATPKGSGGSK